MFLIVEVACWYWKIVQFIRFEKQDMFWKALLMLLFTGGSKLW